MINRLALSYCYCDKPCVDGSGTYRDITYDFRIDGKPFYRCLDLYELVRSTKGEGEFFLITCTCGEAGCAGIFDGVLVTHEGESIRWKVPTPLQAPDTDCGVAELNYDEFVFERNSYVKVIREALMQLKEYISSFDGDIRTKIHFGVEEGPRADRILELHV